MFLEYGSLRPASPLLYKALLYIEATEEKNKIPKSVFIILFILLLIAIGVFCYIQFKPKANESFDVSYNVGVEYEERI